MCSCIEIHIKENNENRNISNKVHKVHLILNFLIRFKEYLPLFTICHFVTQKYLQNFYAQDAHKTVRK